VAHLRTTQSLGDVRLSAETGNAKHTLKTLRMTLIGVRPDQRVLTCIFDDCEALVRRLRACRIPIGSSRCASLL
jgi:hypothetical protein